MATSPKALIKLKSDIIENNTDKFFKDLNDLKSVLFGDVQEYLSNFDSVNGRFQNNTHNQKLLFGFRDALIKTLSKVYNINLESYVNSFDQIGDINTQIQSGFGNQYSPSVFIHTFTIEQVTSSLSLERAVDEAILPKLRQQLFNYVVGKQPRKDALANLKTVVNNDTGLERWSSTIANDSLRIWDGQIQKEIVNTFDTEGYHYDGSLIATSRPQCVRWIRELAGFIDWKQLRIEVENWKDAKGYDDAMQLTVQNFPAVCGGYNCRHSATAGFRFK